VTLAQRLDLDGGLESLPLLLLPGIGLEAHDATTPVSPALLVLIGVALLDSRHELAQLRLVLRLDLSQRKDSSSLLVDHSAETGLALHDGVWDSHFAAECGQEDDELDGVNIVGDEDEIRLLVLDEADDMVETVLDGVGLGGDLLALLALGNGGGFLRDALLLLSLGLWAVLVEELEGLSSLVAVEAEKTLADLFLGSEYERHTRSGTEQAQVEPSGAW
jgi:hypothetical protein